MLEVLEVQLLLTYHIVPQVVVVQVAQGVMLQVCVLVVEEVLVDYLKLVVMMVVQALMGWL